MRAFNSSPPSGARLSTRIACAAASAVKAGRKVPEEAQAVPVVLRAVPEVPAAEPTVERTDRSLRI